MAQSQPTLCCVKGFQWNGTPKGTIGKLANNTAYITGTNPDRAILLIHDLLSFEWPNTRLLADHYADEANATVYVPDFFHGEHLPFEPIVKGRFHEIDINGFMKNHTREIREPEIFDCARALRQKHKFVGVTGGCYGGWAGFRLGAKEHDPPLVDAISAAHPTFLTEKDVDEVAVPVQLIVPEVDPTFTKELKRYTFERLIDSDVPFDYQYFPGVEHSFTTRGDEEVPRERESMVRAKMAVVAWFAQWLQ